jgi:hypothetical protein
MNCVRYEVLLQPVEKQMCYLDKYGTIRKNYIPGLMKNSQIFNENLPDSPPSIILVKSDQDAILTN